MKCILKLKSDHFYYARGSHVSSGKSGASAGEVTDAPDDPQTPIQTTGSRQLQTTPLSIKSSTGSIPHVDSPGIYAVNIICNQFKTTCIITF